MDEIRTVIRDQGLKNTQLLGVMAKQQSEAHTAAAAAMIAQNEALKIFQKTIASVVVPLSQRHPRQCTYPRKTPSFRIETKNGHTYSSGYTKSIKSDRPRKSRKPWKYVSPTRHKRRGIRAFQGSTAELGSVCQSTRGRFMPSDIKNRLTEELGRLKWTEMI